MKTASESRIAQINTALKNDLAKGPEQDLIVHLRTVADAFIQAQQRRNDADYNMAKEWTSVEVRLHIATVSEAFKAWNLIRNEAFAQAYLVSLLGTKERRQSQTPHQNPNKTSLPSS